VRIESKVIRLLSIIHKVIILDLVCGFGGSVGEDCSCCFPSIRSGKCRRRIPGTVDTTLAWVSRVVVCGVGASV